MGEKQGKGFFKKFISVLSGKPVEDQSTRSSKGKFAPSEKEPLDISFVKRFTQSGGKFLYCETTQEIQDYLGQIGQEVGLHQVFCRDENVQSILSKIGFKYSSTDYADADAFFTSSEYLISYNGGIMLTQKQTAGIKYQELPEVFVVLASTSQIVENLRAGLAGIRNKYKGDLPGQITTVKGPKDTEIQQQAGGGSSCHKNVYLILLEDEL